MPFTPANQSALTKFLPAAALEIFCKAASEGETAGLVYNDCIRQGWAATREAGWQPPITGKKWLQPAIGKGEPGSGDVHVPAPMGSKKPKKKSDDAQKFEFSSDATICKIDDSLGLVFGFAVICKQGGEDYFDTQDDHIPEDAMLKAASDFMENSRVAKEMHAGDAQGTIVFAFPLTADIAKAMSIETQTTGLMIAMKPPPEILSKFRSGEYTGFSIGGQRESDEEVA